MIRRFASYSSQDADITNLQLYFWQLAVAGYRLLESRHRDTGFLLKDDYLIAIASLIHAGASLTQLAGQNDLPDTKNRTPSTRESLEKKLKGNIPLLQRAKEFIILYDDLRHFGPAKRDVVSNLDARTYINNLKTVQDVWCEYLKLADKTIGDEFQHVFQFEYENTACEPVDGMLPITRIVVDAT